MCPDWFEVGSTALSTAGAHAAALPQRKLSMRNENFFSKNSTFFLCFGVLYNLKFKPKKQRNQHNKGINKETNQNIYPGFGSSYANLLQGAPGPVASACSLGLGLIFFIFLIFFFGD